MADVQISALTNLAAITADDLFFVRNDPAGTPGDRKATASVVRDYIISGLGVVLIWDDVSDYIPAALKASTNPKEFRGPTDPDTVSGVVLSPYDTWINTA